MSHTPRARRPAAGGPGRGGGPPSLRLPFTPTWHLEVAKLTVTVTQATVIGSIRLRLSESAPPAGRRLFEFKYVLY